MFEQFNEKETRLVVANVRWEQLEVQIQTLAFRTDGDAGDCRDLVAAGPVAEDRRFSPWSPRLAHTREKKKPGFVYEDEVGTHPRGVFFTTGQCSRFHSSIAFSSRSRARRLGF